MKSNGNLVNVIMDGVTDTNMLFDYAEAAHAENNDALYQWFKTKAEERRALTESAWADARKVLKLDDSSDDMAICLRNHINREMGKLKERAMHK